MDNSAVSSPVVSPIPDSSSPNPSLPEKLKGFLSKHRKPAIAFAVLIIILLSTLILFNNKEVRTKLKLSQQSEHQNGSNLPENVVAQVGGAPIYKTFLDLEMSQSKSTPSAELNKKIVNKLIDDELTLQFGREQGIINHEANSETMNDSQYQQRLHDVALVKQSIIREGDHYKGEIVAINFYNNGENSLSDLDRNKLLASQRINELYTKVKNNQLTMEQAGELLKKDTTLSRIDSALEQNAYNVFTVNKGRNITFWLDFDELLLKTQNEELTEVYLGRQKDQNGVEHDAIYLFGRMTEKIENQGYSTYQQWLNKQRSHYEIIL